MKIQRLGLGMVDRRNRLMVTMRHRPVDMVDRRNLPTVTTRRLPAAMVERTNLPTEEEFLTIFPQELVVAQADAMILMTSHLATLDALRATPTARIKLRVDRLDRRNLEDPTMTMSLLALVNMAEDEAEEMRLQPVDHTGALNVEAEMIGMRLPPDHMVDLSAVVETRTLMDRTPLIPTVVSKVADRVVAITITRLTSLGLTSFLGLRSLYSFKYLLVSI